jgi:hypothetical protein
MTQPLQDLNSIIDTPFDELDAGHTARIFGVEYARLILAEGGELFVTRTGWQRLPALLPETWFLNNRYAKEGYRLPGGTGNVFRLEAPVPTKPNLRLVVKIARSGQDVPLDVTGTFPDDISPEDVVSARWNSPFEEFGLVNELRRGRFGPQDLCIRTKRPLAIYCPPSEYKDWQLGRSGSVWDNLERSLQHAQEVAPGEAVHLHASRIYIMLFEWVDGENAEDCWKAGLISEEEMQELTKRVVGELAAKGFRVLDNKPRHFILRPQEGKGPMRRGGELVYALIDFELLQRTAACEDWHRQRKKTSAAT